jgi:hypothetical protein
MLPSRSEDQVGLGVQGLTWPGGSGGRSAESRGSLGDDRVGWVAELAAVTKSGTTLSRSW